MITFSIQFSDDYIKSQGLEGKYVIPICAVHAGMGIGIEEVEAAEAYENASSNDSIVIEEENNDILCGQRE